MFDPLEKIDMLRRLLLSKCQCNEVCTSCQESITRSVYLVLGW